MSGTWYDRPFNSESGRVAALKRWAKKREREQPDDEGAYWRRQPDILVTLLERALSEDDVSLTDALAACRRGRPTAIEIGRRDVLALALYSGTISHVDTKSPTGIFARRIARFGLPYADWAQALGVSERTIARLLERAEELVDAAEHEWDVSQTSPEELEAAQRAEDLRVAIGGDALDLARREAALFDDGLCGMRGSRLGHGPDA